ncbi:esterase [Gordonia phage Hollow]|nr:esterase [Gordonia phage Hollow]
MPLPEITLDPTEYGTVTWTGLVSRIDSVLDPDDLPDKSPVTGSIIFKPSAGALKFLGASPQFTMFLIDRTVNIVDAQVDEQGRKYIKLESNSAHSTPEAFTWTAVFNLEYDGKIIRVPDAKFSLQPGQVLDLSTVLNSAEVTYYTPMQLSAAVAARAGAEAARDEAVEASISASINAIQATPELGYSTPMAPAPPQVTVGAAGSSSPFSGTVLPADTMQVTRRSGRYATQFIDSKFWLQNYVNNPSTSRSQGDIEFTFSGSSFAVHVNALLVSAGIRVWVDGQAISADPLVTHNSGASRSQNWITVSFSASSVRRIRIEFPGSLFGGLSFDSGAVTPIVGRLKRVAIFGDSWAGGTAEVPVHKSIYTRLGYELGWETARLGQGGSGYVQTGSGTGVPYTHADRRAELVAFKPDYVVIIGSLNDDAQSQSSVASAAESLYSSIMAVLPTARLIVVGPQSTRTVVPSSRLANRDAIKEKALLAPNVARFVDPIEEAWITGSGTEAAPAGDGNADSYVLADGIHLNASGCAYWANRLAVAILRP